MASFTVITDDAGSAEMFAGEGPLLGFTAHGLLWTKRNSDYFRVVWSPGSWRKIEIPTTGSDQKEVMDIFTTD